MKGLDLPVEAVDLTIPMPGDEPKGPVSEASIQQGRQALAKIRAAHGGDAILKVKDFTQKGTMAMQGPQGPVDIGQTVTWLAPNHVRQSQATPNGELTVYFDGSSGWIAAPQRSQELPPPFCRRTRIPASRSRS